VRPGARTGKIFAFTEVDALIPRCCAEDEPPKTTPQSSQDPKFSLNPAHRIGRQIDEAPGSYGPLASKGVRMTIKQQSDLAQGRRRRRCGCVPGRPCWAKLCHRRKLQKSRGNRRKSQPATRQAGFGVSGICAKIQGHLCQAWPGRVLSTSMSPTWTYAGRLWTIGYFSGVVVDFVGGVALWPPTGVVHCVE
jgi:hypothetical protein